MQTIQVTGVKRGKRFNYIIIMSIVNGILRLIIKNLGEIYKQAMTDIARNTDVMFFNFNFMQDQGSQRPDKEE